MIGLDTNILLRFLTQDHPAQSKQVFRSFKQLKPELNMRGIYQNPLCWKFVSLCKQAIHLTKMLKNVWQCKSHD